MQFHQEAIKLVEEPKVAIAVSGGGIGSAIIGWTEVLNPVLTCLTLIIGVIVGLFVLAIQRKKLMAANMVIELKGMELDEADTRIVDMASKGWSFRRK